MEVKNENEIEIENSKLQEWTQKADKYKKLVDKLKEMMVKNKQQIKQDRERYDELHSKYKQLQEENDTLNTLGKDLEQLTQNRNELESMLNKSEGERNKLADENAELMTNLRSINQNIEEYEIKNTNLQNQLQNKETENQNLRGNLVKEIDELKTKNSVIQNELENIHKKRFLTPSEPISIGITPYVSAPHSPSRNDAEKVKLKEKIKKFQKNFQIVKEKYKELKNKLDISKDALRNKDMDMLVLQEQLNILKQMVTDTKQRTQIQKTRISDGQNQQKALEIRVVELERLLNVSQQEKDDIRRVSVQLQSEIEVLRKDKKTSDEFGDFDGAEMEKLKAENEGLKVDKNVLEKENKKLKTENNELVVKMKDNVQKIIQPAPGFDIFDNRPSRTVTEPCTPNKNQTIVGKKELGKLRKKAEQFTTLLTKAKALKDKNKELKAEINKKNAVQHDLGTMKELEQKLKAEIDTRNVVKDECEELEKKCNELESMVENQKFDLEESNDRLEEIEGENDKLKVKFNKLRETNKHSKQDLAGKCLELAELKMKYATQINTENEVKEALSVEEGDASKLSWEYLLNKQKEEADMEQEKINKLQKLNKKLTGEVDKYKDGVKKLLREKQEFVEMQSKFSYMEKEHETSQRMLSEMERKYKLLQEQYENLKFEQDISDSEEESKHNGMEELVKEKNELDKLRMENEKVINELQSELCTVKSQIQSGDKERESMGNKKDVMIQELQEKVREMMSVKKKIGCELDLSMEKNNELTKEVGLCLEKENEMKEVIARLKKDNQANISNISIPSGSPMRNKTMDSDEEDGLSLNEEEQQREKDRLYGSDSDNDNDNDSGVVEDKSENKKEVIKTMADVETETEINSFDLFDSTKSDDKENDDDESEATNMVEKIMSDDIDDIDDSVEPKEESKEETPVKSSAPPPPTPPIPTIVAFEAPPPLSPLEVGGMLMSSNTLGIINDTTSIDNQDKANIRNDNDINNDNEVKGTIVKSVEIPTPAPDHPAPAASSPKSFRGRGKRGRGRGRGRGRRRGRGRGRRPKSAGMGMGMGMGRGRSVGIGGGRKRRSMTGTKSLTRTADISQPDTETNDELRSTDQTDKTDKVVENETVKSRADAQSKDLMMARKRGVRTIKNTNDESVIAYVTDKVVANETVKSSADAVPETAAVHPKSKMTSRSRMASRKSVRRGKGRISMKSRKRRIGGKGKRRMKRPTTPTTIPTIPTPPVESTVNQPPTDKQVVKSTQQLEANKAIKVDKTVIEKNNQDKEPGSVPTETETVTVKKEENAVSPSLKPSQIVKEETNDTNASKNQPIAPVTTRTNRMNRSNRIGRMNKTSRRRPVNKAKSRGSALDRLKSGMNEMENSVQAPKRNTTAPKRNINAPTHPIMDKNKKKKTPKTPIFPVKKKGITGTIKSWFGFGNQKAVYKAPKTETVMDANGDSHTIYKPDLNQYTQVKQTWNEELGRWVFDDGEPMDEDSDSDDGLPPIALRKRKVDSHKLVEKENVNISNVSDVDSLRREIIKLKEENNKLKQQVGIRGRSEMKYDSNSDIVGLDVMQQRMLDGLDQNHRILRYLHSWADNLPNVLDNRVTDDIMDMSDNASFGISMFHIILILILTVCLLFWDSNNVYNDMDIFNSMIAFLKELYMIFHQFLPQSLHVYENMVIQFAQNAINQTLLTQNIKLEL